MWFTSSGTEANNWAVTCIQHSGEHVTCSAVEHSSVRKAFGEDMDVISVDENGIVSLDELMSFLEDGDTGLVSIQYANQDTGVKQNVSEIADICKFYDVPLHVDACMAFGVEDIDIYELGCNFLTISSHKIWGPVGAGALASDGKFDISPLLVGGNQEFGMRAGAINMPSIAGFACACRKLKNKSQWRNVAKLRDKIEVKFEESVKKIGSRNRIPNMMALCFEGHDASFLSAELERRHDVNVGVGGTSESNVSSALVEMGISIEDCNSTLRFRFGPKFNNQDADRIIVGLQSAMREEQTRQII